MKDKRSGYSIQALRDVELVLYTRKIYIPISMCRFILDWCQFNLNQPGGEILKNNTQQVCYWKGLSIQVGLSVNPWNMWFFSQVCKILWTSASQDNWRIKTLEYFIYLPPISVCLTPTLLPGWYILQKDISTTYMTTIYPETGWFGIIQVPYVYLEYIKTSNTENIDKTSDVVRYLWNQAYISR